MYFTNFLVILTAITVSAFEVQLNEFNHTEDYITHSVRKLRTDIEFSNLKIDSVNARGSDLIVQFKVSQHIVLKEIDSFEHHLLVLKTLDPIYKYCIEKYDSVLISVDATEKQLSDCIKKAEGVINILTQSANVAINHAKTVVNFALPKAVAYCNTTYANDRTNLVDCLVYNVTKHAKAVGNHLHTVDKYLESALGSLSQESFDLNLCSFDIEKNALYSISSTATLIGICLNETRNESPSNNITIDELRYFRVGEK